MKQKDVIPADSSWKSISPLDFTLSPSACIGKGWMLISAGDIDSGAGNWNTMTASWGGLGVLWSRDVAFMFIRPSRHSFAFVNNASLFTLSFFGEAQRAALKLCGEASGRDTDKAAAAGLSPIVFTRPPIQGAVGFEEAAEIIVCRKLYTHDFDPAGFLDPSIEKNYPAGDYHRMFIGEILEILRN